MYVWMYLIFVNLRIYYSKCIWQKNELLNICQQKVSISNENVKLTNCAILQSTSTLTRMAVPPQEKVPLNQSLPAKPFIYARTTEPLKRTGNISKCHACKSNLDDYVFGRIESDFFLWIQKEKNIKIWFPETNPKYYHTNLLCLKKRRPNAKVTREIIKFNEDAVITEEIEVCLI